MSDAGADDLFGDSDNEAPDVRAKEEQGNESIKASSSRGVSPAPIKAESSAAQAAPPSEKGSATGDVDDLFGDDDDAPPPESQGRTRTGTSASTSRSGTPQRANALEYEEEEVEAQEEQVQWANHVVPTWRRLGGTDGRLPAYINLEAKPYEPRLYRAELDEEEVTGLAAKSRMIGVKNTLRWRWVKGEDGEYKKQSNARVLRWSDGSASLQLGSDLFDIATSAGASLARPSDPVPESKPSSSALNSTPTPSASQTGISGQGGAVTYVCAAIGSAGVLMAEAPLAGQLSLVPTSMNSKTHMELVRHVGQQHTKHSKLKILDHLGDPEKSGEGLMRFATAKTKRAPRRSGAGGGGGRRRGARKWRGGKDSDDDDDERERQRPLGVDRGEYEDDGFVVDDDDEDDDAGGGLGSSDEEEEYQSRRKSGRSSGKSSKKRKSTRGREYSDDDDDEDDDGELDAIEIAERELEDKERERKRAKRDSGPRKSSSNSNKDKQREQERKRKSREYIDTEDEEEDAEGEEDMDVESEDD